ncbi:hypothetical protein JBW_01117 [Pelosinus fermentans JBW45]|uniref:Uncharacterized protein n=1 Tax=Pelosinus fermentans JBW45 TaxID=1192197 RepID=I9NT39_9FIRM|nr:hypothetical protein JBW_01117 [Pelosinus fermentans JBW45]
MSAALKAVNDKQEVRVCPWYGKKFFKIKYGFLD